MYNDCQVKIIDGKKIADGILSDIKQKVSELDCKPNLAILLIGDDPGSHIYVGLKVKAAKKVGIGIHKIILSSEVTESKILEIISELNKDKDCHGILVQFPLPKQIEKDKVIKTILPVKDVDGFHPANIKCLLDGDHCLVPGLAEGIMRLLESTQQDFSDQRAVVIGNSNVFTDPLKYLLADQFKSVDVLHADEVKDIEKYDTVVVAVGRPNFIKGEIIKKGATIIDVGYNLIGGKSVGDVDFESVKEKAGWITPVPGGVGPMTVAMLLNNVVKAYAKQKSLNI